MQKTITSPPKAPSLKELMDEELARKLQNEESKNRSSPIPNPIEFDVEVFEENDVDYSAFEIADETADLSEDLLLALQLQEAEYIAQQHRYDVQDVSQSPNGKYEKVVMSSSSDVYRRYYGEDYGMAPLHPTPSKEFDSDFVRSKGVNVPTVKPNQANKPFGRQTTPSRRNRSNSKKNAINGNNPINSGNVSPTKQSGFDQINTNDSIVQQNDEKHENDLELNTNEIDDVSPTKVKSSTGASAKKTKRMEKQEVIRVTSEGVLDGRTRLILYRLRNADVLRELHGCVSEGKEAKVYHAIAGDYDEWETSYPEHGELAIKIFKTTLNEFRSREQYIAGDRRFTGKMKRLNPRKIIKIWAEKEMRNLKRLRQCGINAPIPLALRKHVLVMSFLGKDGWPAPQLAQAKLDDNKLRAIYIQVILMMRRMFQMCELVHADLSEYNILIWHHEPYLLDVAQAVEHHHPNAVTFLKRDCLNITKFFHKKGVHNCMTTRELFQFVTDASIPVGGEEKYLNQVQERKAKESTDNDVISPEDEVEERLFMSTFIPRTLSEVRDPDQEIQDLMDGKALKSIYHHTITGLNQTDLSGIMPSDDVSDDSDSDDTDSEEDLDENIQIV